MNTYTNLEYHEGASKQLEKFIESSICLTTWKRVKFEHCRTNEADLKLEL